ncbi:MarR family transcriptional regulator [bacterium]|nr:MarR family transcriptional regulator [bacterium]
MSTRVISLFRRLIRDYYKEHGRDLPWRRTADPYHIFVSEVMLQQTQAPRVAAKFPRFIQAFPTVESLAGASTHDVLAAWQGMGYNRRALALKKSAAAIVGRHAGRIPRTVEELDALPGIGHATACSIAAFAFNEPVVFIETNIRAVFIQFFFPEGKRIDDTEIEGLLTAAMDRTNTREWYNALMDYGAMLKGREANPARRSAHHRAQPRFEGSRRQLRGRVITLLTRHAALTKTALASAAECDRKTIETVLAALEKEGFVTRLRGRYSVC